MTFTWHQGSLSPHPFVKVVLARFRTGHHLPLSIPYVLTVSHQVPSNLKEQGGAELIFPSWKEDTIYRRYMELFYKEQLCLFACSLVCLFVN